MSNKEFAEYVIETLCNGDELTLEQIERLDEVLKKAVAVPEETRLLSSPAACRCRELRAAMEKAYELSMYAAACLPQNTHEYLHGDEAGPGLFGWIEEFQKAYEALSAHAEGKK